MFLKIWRKYKLWWYASNQKFLWAMTLKILWQDNSEDILSSHQCSSQCSTPMFTTMFIPMFTLMFTPMFTPIHKHLHSSSLSLQSAYLGESQHFFQQNIDNVHNECWLERSEEMTRLNSWTFCCRSIPSPSWLLAWICDGFKSQTFPIYKFEWLAS